jgi:hypothetical protein
MTMREKWEAMMTNSEMTEDNRGAKEKLAIASLVLAFIALLGVYPLALIGSNIYCMIVFGDCTYYDSWEFLERSCLPSAAPSVLAIILGLISLRGGHLNARTWLFALSGIVLGFVYWPLAILSMIILLSHTL